MDEWIKVTLMLYKEIRVESMQSLKNQLTTLQVGMASIGVLIGTGISTWDKEWLLPSTLFIFFVPVICYISLFIWISEVARMMRAGKFNCLLEQKINSHFNGNPVLNWENWLRSKDLQSKTPQINWSYSAILLLFFFCAFFSNLLGLYRMKDESTGLLYTVSITSLVVYVFVVISIFKFCRRLINS